jgi:polyisoprenoid-binding protein YceI
MKAFALLVALLIAAIAAAQPILFKVVPGSPNTLMQFKSAAMLDTVVGQTNTVTGYIAFDGNTGHSEIHVDLASLKTGNVLRDEQIHGDHLETAKYPEAVFSAATLDLPAGGLEEGWRTRVNMHGNLTLHGVTHEIVPETYLTLQTGGHALRIESAFEVKLADYDIPRPELLLLRVAEEQQITVDIMAINDTNGELSGKGGN